MNNVTNHLLWAKVGHFPRAHPAAMQLTVPLTKARMQLGKAKGNAFCTWQVSRLLVVFPLIDESGCLKSPWPQYSSTEPWCPQQRVSTMR